MEAEEQVILEEQWVHQELVMELQIPVVVEMVLVVEAQQAEVVLVPVERKLLAAQVATKVVVSDKEQAIQERVG